MPEGVDQLVFPALQTYEGGEVVRWIETSTDEGAEPEHPAPVLELVPAAGMDGDTGTATPAAQARPTEPASSSTWWALGLSIPALIVGLGAAVGAGIALRRTRG